ncbi:PEP-CTERM sorting domain-containing protein [Verrucomicrobia bacterium S94]|nr:PEP-CTERM sorting domain-containing protein [Verrucomicrobia bacterium S94]
MKPNQLITTMAAVMICSASFAVLIPANVTVTGDPATGAGATITFNHDVNFTIENDNSIGLIRYHFGVLYPQTDSSDNLTASSPTLIRKNGVDTWDLWRYQEARYEISNWSALWTYDTGGISVGDVLTIPSGTTVTLGAGSAETQLFSSGTYNMWLQGNSGSLLAGEISTAIPEPSAIALIAFFGGGILFVRRRLMM